jgi:phospholipid/cholesterol/gamma-HCH transport system substrate-binding protein
MPRRRRERAEVWIGLLVIASSALLLWGYFWLTGRPIGEAGYTVVMQMPAAEGLERGDRVRISGVEVGSVLDVRLDRDGTVWITAHLGRGVEIPADSRAILQSTGLFGGRFVDVKLGSATTSIAEGDTLRAEVATSLGEIANQLGDEARSVLAQVERLLSDTAIDRVHGGVAALEGTVRRLEGLVSAHGDEFARLSESLVRTAETVERSVDSPEAEETAADLRHTAANLADVSDSLIESANALASISAKVDRGDGTLGRLVNDPSLYEDLQATARSIADLSQDIRENPRRYLRFAIF